MKYIQTVTSFILITFLFSTPSKQDFSDAFIKVADKGNPTVVSIVSEKTIENNIHYFKLLFDHIYDNFNDLDKMKGSSSSKYKDIITTKNVENTTPNVARIDIIVFCSNNISNKFLSLSILVMNSLASKRSTPINSFGTK